MKRFMMLLMMLCLLFGQAEAEKGKRALPDEAKEMFGSWEVKWLRINGGEKRPSTDSAYDGMEVELREDRTITFCFDGEERTYDWDYDTGYYVFKSEDGTYYHFDIHEYVNLVIYEDSGDFYREITGVLLERPKAETAAAKSALPVAPAEEFEYWEGEDGGICVSRYLGSMTELAVPAEIDGLPVTQIGDHAFWTNESLLRVEIPGSVKRIGDFAFDRCAGLYEVIIQEGVEEIGRGALRSCEALGSVKLPGNLQILGDEAFAYCKNLTNIELQEGLVSIGALAFKQCEGIESIALPQSVETIGDNAFDSCMNLKDVTLSKNLISMGIGVFENCYDLAAVTVPEGCAFECVSGMIINTRERTLMAYLRGVKEKHVAVPEGVERIAPRAFSYCNNFESIALPEGLLEIGDEAFAGTRIKEIVFPASLERMDSIFGNANSLTQITVAEGNETFKAEGGLLYNMKEKSLILAANGQMTGHVTVEEGTQTIGRGVFMNSGITGVTLPDSLRTIGKSAFYSASFEALELPEGLETIGVAAFGGCAQLSEVVLPDSVVSMGERAFAGCEVLTSVKLSTGLTAIPESAFNGCGALTEIVIPEGVVAIKSRAFGNSGLQRVTLPASLEEIHKEAFYKCDGLAATVQQGTYAAQFCDEYGVQKAGEAAVYAFAVEEIDGGLRITGLVGETASLAIPREIGGLPVLEIAEDAFRGNAQITKVSVGNTVTQIGAHAFAECTALKEFEMREHIDTISEGLFEGCTSLETVTVYQPKTISTRAFAGCVKLRQVRHLEWQETIGESAFAGCESLESLTLPRDVRISEGAFEGCTKLVVSTRAGDSTVRYCYQNDIAVDLTELPARYFRYTLLEDGTIRIDGFAEHESEVVIPRFIAGRQVTQIADKAFDDERISGLHLPEGLVSIGDGAFMSIYDLELVNIPSSVKSIGEQAFAFCEDLSMVFLHEGLETIGDHAFAWCTSLSEPAIPESVTEIGRDVFFKKEE